MMKETCVLQERDRNNTFFLSCHLNDFRADQYESSFMNTHSAPTH